MLVKDAQALYCPKCGTRLLGAMACPACNGQARKALAPAVRVRSNQIPGVVGAQLTKVQSDGLAFGAKSLIVKSAVIQSFNLGSSSAGTVKFAGLGRSFGPWAVFGGMGTINQTTVNAYRTDIQIKLEDESGQKAFLNYSLPFAITLAIEPGESLLVYFVRGGLQKPTAPEDFRIDVWTPFLAENTDTDQLVPIAGVPTLGAPTKGFLKAAIMGTLFTFLLMVGQAGVGPVALSSLVTLPFVVGAMLRAHHYKLSLADASGKAATSTV